MKCWNLFGNVIIRNFVSTNRLLNLTMFFFIFSARFGVPAPKVLGSNDQLPQRVRGRTQQSYHLPNRSWSLRRSDGAWRLILIFHNIALLICWITWKSIKPIQLWALRWRDLLFCLFVCMHKRALRDGGCSNRSIPNFTGFEWLNLAWTPH